MTRPNDDLMWSFVFQLSMNSYSEDAAACGIPDSAYLKYRPEMHWDDTLWAEVVPMLVDAGCNHIVLSLSDGIRYDSHPEIAVDGAWTPSELRAEVARLKDLGITVAPKLNFSADHDLWLGEYGRMVSTSTYYQVCSDLIEEVISLFDTPPLFHLGYDEETYENQTWYEYAVVRQHGLWWQDFEWFLKQVRSRGSRPWMWSDFAWKHAAEVAERIPRSVLQSNWYYAANFDRDVDAASARERGLDLSVPVGEGRTETTPLQAYVDLDEMGFEQVPAGSVWSDDDNFRRTVEFSQRHLTSERVLGFMQTVWKPLLPEYRDRFLLGVQKFREARDAYDPDGWSKDDSGRS